MTDKVLLCWSGGKDSALALHELLQGGEKEVAALLTTVTKDYDRISMHGVRRELLERQATSVGLPLEVVFLSKDGSNEEYEAKMAGALQKFLDLGVREVVFGDLYLEDVRRYREENLARVGMEGLFPLWGRETRALALSFIELGFQALISCVDSEALDGSFAGRTFDRQFLEDLPAGADPCGENGEFHSFVFDGPLFKERVLLTKGEVTLRDGRFYYCDFLPAYAPS
jgi:uncharacterized protein (TIGR00290 family)